MACVLRRSPATSVDRPLMAPGLRMSLDQPGNLKASPARESFPRGSLQQNLQFLQTEDLGVLLKTIGVGVGGLRELTASVSSSQYRLYVIGETLWHITETS